MPRRVRPPKLQDNGFAPKEFIDCLLDGIRIGNQVDPMKLLLEKDPGGVQSLERMALLVVVKSVLKKEKKRKELEKIIDSYSPHSFIPLILGDCLPISVFFLSLDTKLESCIIGYSTSYLKVEFRGDLLTKAFNKTGHSLENLLKIMSYLWHEDSKFIVLVVDGCMAAIHPLQTRARAMLPDHREQLFHAGQTFREMCYRRHDNVDNEVHWDTNDSDIEVTTVITYSGNGMN